MYSILLEKTKGNWFKVEVIWLIMTLWILIG